MKVIFGGVELGDIYEQIAEVERATQELTRGIAQRASLLNVVRDSADLTRDFKNNANQISSVQTIVKVTEENTVEKIGYDADKFKKAYSDYTPKVIRTCLNKNDTLWSAFKDPSCDLLTGAEGVGATIGKGVGED